MSEDASFQDLIRRVRAGDERAAAEVVRRYEPAVRVAVRVRLTDPGLRRVLDSVDVCQSVLGDFFVRAACGQFELDRPEQLLGLLVTMARNKLTNQALKHHAARRDQARVRHGLPEEVFPADPSPSPSRVVAGEELLRLVRGRLSPAERVVAERRAQGQGWAEIAAELGDRPDALRIRFSRKLNRVAQELGIS